MALRGRILLVDDDKGFCELISTVLEGAGYMVIEAPEGRRALELLDRVSPNLVLVDVTLPSGMALVRELHARSETRGFGVVAMSSAVQAGQSPTMWFLHKPVRPEILLGIAGEFCGHRAISAFWSQGRAACA